MKALAAVALFALCGCAELQRLAPLELQPPEVKKPEPVAFDVGNLSVRCVMNDQLLRFIVVQGDTIVKALCDDPPNSEPRTKS